MMTNFDLGPLETLLKDEHVTEILVNRYDVIFVERRGKLEKTEAKFDSEAHLQEVARKIAEPTGQALNESNPLVDSRLQDGTLVNIVLYPIAVDGTVMNLRKFSRSLPNEQDLIQFGSWTQEMVDFLKHCVKAGLNLMVAGGTGSGKTTVFNILTSFIPDDERIVVAEWITELQLQNQHVVRMEARPANIEGRGEITVQQLVRNALKMRPERIIVGEVRGGEAMDLIQAMNTGHDGSMFTMHATNVRDALSRFEAMMTMAGIDVPLLTIREQIGMALNVIVSQQRLRDGSRRITKIAEVTGTHGGIITTQDIFEFVDTGMENGRMTGYFSPTGYVPQFIQRLRDAGFTTDDSFFTI